MHLVVIYLQKTFLIENSKINIKNLESSNWLRASGGVLILIRNDISQSKIDLNTNLQAIAAKAILHKTINICSLYRPPHAQSAGAVEYTDCISAEG